MAILSKGVTFADGEQVTSTRLNNLVDQATFNSGAVDGSTMTLINGQLAVSVVQTSNIANGAVTNTRLGNDINASKLTAGTLPIARIADGAVTNAKLASGIDASKLTTGTLPIARIANGAITAAKLSGNQTGSAPIYAIRAVGRYDLTSSRTLRAGSQNIASVTRLSSGQSQVTFNTSMPNSNYIVICSKEEGQNGSGTRDYNSPVAFDRTSTGFKINEAGDSNSRGTAFIVIG